eukprot:scaffold12194_cov129-Cylindrotheca_fusiformis.AAC.3
MASEGLKQTTESLKQTTENLKQALNFVADELMFIFFTDECSTRNDDESTNGSSRLSYLSSIYGGSNYTHETASTVSNLESTKMVSSTDLSLDEANVPPEDREKGHEAVLEGDESVGIREAVPDTESSEGTQFDSNRETGSESKEETRTDDGNESEVFSVDDDVLNIFFSESEVGDSKSEEADGLEQGDADNIGKDSIPKKTTMDSSPIIEPSLNTTDYGSESSEDASPKSQQKPVETSPKGKKKSTEGSPKSKRKSKEASQESKQKPAEKEETPEMPQNEVAVDVEDTEPKKVTHAPSLDVIDLCDAEEVIDENGEGSIVSNLEDSITSQRLHRLRETKEKLRSEREKWEAEFGDDDSMKRRIIEAREKKNAMKEIEYLEQQRMREKMIALSRTVSGESGYAGRARLMNSEDAIIDYHGKQIQKKIQTLSRMLDDIMMKKMNGEFPDDAESREMEAAIRANLVEFQKWWRSTTASSSGKKMPKVRPPRPPADTRRRARHPEEICLL